MDKVMMVVTRITKTFVEVPVHLDETMRTDEALRLTGRGEGILGQTSIECKAQIEEIKDCAYEDAHRRDIEWGKKVNK